MIYRFMHRTISRLVLPSAVRRAAYVLVLSSSRIRTTATRYMAAFAWRFPPRLSRIRFVLPLDAGIGQTPHIFAKAASDLMRSGLSPIRMNISATVIVEMPNDIINAGALSVTMRSSSRSCSAISSCSINQRRAMARMVAFADEFGERISPGRNTAMWRIKAIGPLIWSSASRRSDGAFIINVRKVIIACDLAFIALSEATLMCRIISDDPVGAFARAVACPFRTDRAALSASRLSDLP